MLHEGSREELRVYTWRRRCLLQMGVPRPYARLLAQSDADLHQMLALLRHGATADQVRRLML